MMVENAITKVALVALIVVVVALYSYWHARSYREGLPPVFDAFFSGVAFACLCLAYVFAGRVGETYGMVTEGRVAGLAAAFMLMRWLRARLGVELAGWKARK